MPNADWLVLFLLAACGGSGSSEPSNVIVPSHYETTCKVDSDCMVVETGTITCCDCPNGAINVADKAAYDADLAAAEKTIGICSADCISCPAVRASCTAGRCQSSPVGTDGGG
jgi:hypothetical protein